MQNALHDKSIRLSVVIPMYNEEQVMPHLFARLRPVLDGMNINYEVVCIDDGSRDRTASMLQDSIEAWPELRLLRLTKNSGHQAALTAGLANCYGSYAVSIDADLQDPPELIPEMYAKAVKEKLDVVYAAREDRSSDTWFKRNTASAYYKMMRKIAGKQVPDNAADFRLISRRVLEALRQIPEYDRVYRLLIPWFGFPSGIVTFTREERPAGESKYPLSKMVNLSIDSVTNFTNTPLRFATYIGIFASIASFIYGVYLVFRVFTGDTVPGWASTVLFVLFFGAANLLCVGIIGEYMGRLITNSQARPLYIVGYDSSKDQAVQANLEPSREYG
ncbi:MAG: glycosyltransferase family 2 protein [Micrococcaceae bacterium]